MSFVRLFTSSHYANIRLCDASVSTSVSCDESGEQQNEEQGIVSIVTYVTDCSALDSGRLAVTTDKVAPSRDEYIASTQRAFAKGAQTMAAHPEAFSTGRGEAPAADT